MPLTVRKFNAQVRDPTSGNMIPAGLISSDALGAINTAKTNAVAAVQTQQTTSVNAVTAAGTAAAANFPATADACDTLAADFADTYVPDQAYAVGEYCTYQYKLYQCKTAIAVNTDHSFVASHWNEITVTETLNNQVGDLKTHFENKIIRDQKNEFYFGFIVESEYIDANGRFQLATSRHRTDFIAIPDGMEKLYIDSVQNVGNYCYFYNEADDSTANTRFNIPQGESTIAIPVDAKYFAISALKTVTFNDVHIFDITKNIREELEEQDEKLFQAVSEVVDVLVNGEPVPASLSEEIAGTIMQNMSFIPTSLVPYVVRKYNVSAYQKIKVVFDLTINDTSRNAIVVGDNETLEKSLLNGNRSIVNGYSYDVIIPPGYTTLYVQSAHAYLYTTGEALPEYNYVPLPSIVYTRKEYRNNPSININNSIFPEGFVFGASQRATINDWREFPVSRLNDRETINNTIKLSVKGYKDSNISFTTKMVTPENIAGKAFLMCIGESTTEQSVLKPESNVLEKFWGWPSAVQYFAEIDHVSYNNAIIKTIGHKKNNQLAFDWGENHLTNRSFNCGYGGRPSYWLLNLPTEFGKTSMTTTGLGAETLWYFLGLATKTPYNQTAYNTDKTEYNGSDEQVAQITSTPAGKYKLDGHESLWNLLRDVLAIGDITGTYTGSDAQLAAMNAWAETVFANPYNPFFDIDAVRSGADCAFSIAKYLERYRTMDDEGNRLSGSAGQTVTGQDGNTYTIGTRVENVEAWDVCTPTHVVFNIGINDREQPNAVANSVANIKMLVAQTSVPTAFFICRDGGVCNKAMWSDVATAQEVGFSAYTTDMIRQLTPWFETQQDKYMLPIYHIQTPISSEPGAEFMEDSPTTGNKRYFVEGAVHTGWYGYESIGVQVINWLYYVMSQT